MCCIKKPVYGIPQAGRRLQRGIFEWMLDTSKANLRQLDDSDTTIFVYDDLYYYDDLDGLETFTVGVYVDNLQTACTRCRSRIAESPPTDPDSYLAKFLTLLRDERLARAGFSLGGRPRVFLARGSGNIAVPQNPHCYIIGAGLNH